MLIYVAIVLLGLTYINGANAHHFSKGMVEADPFSFWIHLLFALATAIALVFVALHVNYTHEGSWRV